MKERQPISAIHIFKEFERLVAKTNVYPLTKENLVIQQDAFARLGDIDSSEDGTGEPFATLELGKKESDADLRFMFTFADIGFLLDTEGWGQAQYSYGELGETNSAIARAIFAAASLLSNGQVFVVHTGRAGRICAAEVVYRKTGSDPVLLALQGNYPKFLKSGSADEYDVHILKNAYHTPMFTLKDALPLRAKRADGSPLELKRVYDKSVITPLTKQAYNEIIGATGNDLLGVNDDKDLEQKLFRAPEYWVIGALLSAAIYFLVLRQFDLPVFLAGFAGFIASGYFTAKVMMYKEELRLTNRQTWLTYATDFAGKIFRLEYFYAVVLFGVIVSTSFPIYVLKGSGKLVQLHELADATAAWIAVIFFLVVAAFALSLQKHWLARLASGGLGLATICGLFAANALTDTSEKVKTPEPQTTIAVTLYLLALGLAIAVIAKAWKSRKATDLTETPTS